jgi:hypothetical protein
MLSNWVVGEDVGGAVVGRNVGLRVVGLAVGFGVGARVGSGVGRGVGLRVGRGVGANVGNRVGPGVGAGVGAAEAPGSVGVDVGLGVIGVNVGLVVVGEAVVVGDTEGKLLGEGKCIVGALVGGRVVAVTVGDLGTMGPGTILIVESALFLSRLLDEATAAATVTIMAKNKMTTRHKMTTPERVEMMRWNHDWGVVVVLAAPFAATAIFRFF